jgi:dTDP-glucose pyrophosphorylase
MKIIIPAAGNSKRFKDSGYLESKPFIKIKGSPILEHQLQEFYKDDVQVVLNKKDELKIEAQALMGKFPYVKFIFCNNTGSVIETLSYADTTNELVIIDCDIIVSRSEIAKAKGNYILYFEDNKLIPRYSYLETTTNGTVKGVIEKEKISDMACCGVYGYKKGFNPKTPLTKNEAYQSHYIAQLIKEGEVFKAIKATKYINLGTPYQLQMGGIKVKPIKKIYCFDLDQTLVTKSISGNHEDCKPITQNIRIVNKLFDDGNTIIIHTARRMKTHNGDVGKVIKDIGVLTRKQISRLGIKHHRIEFGKPYADYYIDDKAVFAGEDLGKDLGVYFAGHKTRSFNKVTEVDGGWVKKTGRTVKNEAYWYENINESWLSANGPDFKVSEEALMLSKIEGSTASEIYTEGGLLDLVEYVSKIKELHRSECKPDVSSKQIESWYIGKLKERFKESEYPLGAKDVYLKLLDWASAYKVSKVTQTHGDPVFTNAIKSKWGYKFIDPRGAIGDSQTVYGDPMYDMAKIYQSISGYDFILANARIYESYVDRYQDEFFKITGIDKKTIELITAYLYFTLIPLHVKNREKFFQMSVKMLKSSGI